MLGVSRRGRQAISDGSAQWLRRLLNRRRSQPGDTTNSTQLKPRTPSPGTPGRAKARRHRETTEISETRCEIQRGIYPETVTQCRSTFEQWNIL